jgi:hypothetical protein
MNMRRRSLPLYLISICTVAAFHGAGEPESAEIRPLRLQPPPPPSRNRFGLSARVGFNIETRFRDLGPVPRLFPRLNPAALMNLDGERYNYDNGYVFPDAGTPNSGLTHYWGYQGFAYGGASQLPGNGTILMQRASSGPMVSQGFDSMGREDGALPGLELTYNRELGRDSSFRWGLEAAFNYMNVSARDDQPLRAARSTTVLTDAYPLLVPESLLPPAPYEGRKNTPGVVIGATPQSSTDSTTMQTAMGSRGMEFDADVFGFRLGPYLEVPVGGKFTLGLSGGLSVAEINSDFSFTQVLRSGSLVVSSSRGSSSHNDTLAGGYVEGTASYSFTPKAGIFASAQFQDIGEYSHAVQQKEATLDLSQSIFVSLGFSYSF